MARLFGIRQSAVTEWANKGTVPWNKRKYLSDSQAVSWDWMLEGFGEKESTKEAETPRSTKPRFAKAGINRRFLSLFPGMKQIEIAALLEVTSSTVSEWKKNKSKVPWEKLEHAAAGFGVRWDWLIDGLEPKYREKQGL